VSSVISARRGVPTHLHCSHTGAASGRPSVVATLSLQRPSPHGRGSESLQGSVTLDPCTGGTVQPQTLNPPWHHSRRAVVSWRAARPACECATRVPHGSAPSLAQPGRPSGRDAGLGPAGPWRGVGPAGPADHVRVAPTGDAGRRQGGEERVAPAWPRGAVRASAWPGPLARNRSLMAGAGATPLRVMIGYGGQAAALGDSDGCSPALAANSLCCAAAELNQQRRFFTHLLASRDNNKAIFHYFHSALSKTKSSGMNLLLIARH
jgi:hypothetical protein